MQSEGYAVIRQLTAAEPGLVKASRLTAKLSFCWNFRLPPRRKAVRFTVRRRLAVLNLSRTNKPNFLQIHLVDIVDKDSGINRTENDAMVFLK
jgi:hypothetical protein